MTTELRLAAILALLSSSALRGTTAGKNTALCLHLETLLRREEALDPDLRKTLEKALKEWKLTLYYHCAPARDAQPDHAAVPLLH